MKKLSENPYPEATGLDCDKCDQEVDIAGGFHHCEECEEDWC